jgi:protoheme IX farnesyltransferase
MSLGSTNVSITPQAESRRGRLRTALFDYLALTKPRTIHLVVGAIPPMLLADRGVIAPLLILNTLIGLTLMTAGANTLNCVADADLDKQMKRTSAPRRTTRSNNASGSLVTTHPPAVPG